MNQDHFFVIDDLSLFLADLGGRHYVRSHSPADETWITYSKVLSGALTKSYSFPGTQTPDRPVQVRVVYHLHKGGKELKKLAERLKTLNAQYRQALPIWKTKRPVPESIRHHRRHAVEQFLQTHHE